MCSLRLLQFIVFMLGLFVDKFFNIAISLSFDNNYVITLHINGGRTYDNRVTEALHTKYPALQLIYACTIPT